MFQVPREHVAELEVVKQAVGVHHRYLDGWIYLFLSNKKFDIKETIAKLQRRDNMERTVFSKYTITDFLRGSMRAGIVQYIGRDLEGHPTFYFNTARDHPKAEQRAERQANLDMFLSWAVRCDKKNPSAMVTWLINQKNASLLRNTDLIFQKDMALRISKFFPGVVSRMYICNMSGALTFVMKPLLRQLPSSISDCIFLFSASDIRNGELLKRIDASVLPVDMGGSNDCDNPQNYERFATTVEGYFARCITALNSGLSIKQMEMMEEFGVDKDGNPIAAATPSKTTPPGTAAGIANGAAIKMRESVAPRARMAEAASEEVLDHAAMQEACEVTVDAKAREITVQSATRRGWEGSGAQDGLSDASAAIDWNMSFVSPPVALESPVRRVPSVELMDCISVTGRSFDDSFNSPTAPNGLYRIELTHLDEFSFSSVLRKVEAQRPAKTTSAQSDACVRDWVSFCCQCVEVVPKVEALLEALRRGAVPPPDGDLVSKLRRCGHHIMNLFPQTQATLPFPLLDWYATGATARYRSAALQAATAASDPPPSHLDEMDIFEINPRRLAFRLDCTTPDNLLLSAQVGAVEFVENWDELIAIARRRMRVERRLLLTWPPHTDRPVLEQLLQAKARQLWRQLKPLFRVYIESKVGIAIAEFIRHYGLLIAGGRINERAEWYRQLFTDVLQYRELHRRNWLFYVFPPLAVEESLTDEPPTLEELLRARGESSPTVDAAASLMTLIEQSLQYTTDQLTTEADSGAVATRTIVERYLEVSKTKVYIPYDTQRTGVVPSESIEQHKKAAADALRDAEAPLKELLFIMASQTVLQHEYPSTMSEADIKAGLQKARRAHTNLIAELRQHQRVAMSFTRVCTELQGSFGSDLYNLLATYSAVAVHAEGYALGLEMLLAVAILRTRKDGESGIRDTVTSPTSAEPVPALSLSSEEDAPSAATDGPSNGSKAFPSVLPAVKVDVASLLDTLTAMEVPAARLASLKRVYIY
ncbi:hypothetical protein ABB37_09539 [Leptomonas pyrrhocoris]|uniref:Uncharacterized protein n=1 Tax=Leptomonas pyrrhocoris TaxID=157538 RepID=A0A0M9FQJ0_LEPPY|nr:hypothetical protein ABB37_09539 [Leptomonas pyrrhocoris]KPA73953.1 hypothetical protein ABB37_09539 [Leptomonas pyrrhocoris]|eukprot:XP_015652392.1 hypothetical protein ABB37_09539 [Leptomonas pyrrhocoris]